MPLSGEGKVQMGPGPEDDLTGHPWDLLAQTNKAAFESWLWRPEAWGHFLLPRW